jgi:O-antigen/teichoic acid export membrane protein
MSVYKAIAKNYMANMWGIGLSFLNHIAMVPLFISLWGIDKYADWILITALSSFFTMSNMGLNTVTVNAFVIKYQQQDMATCSRLLTNAFFFVVFVGGLLLLVSVFTSLVWGFNGLLGTKIFSKTETSTAFVLLLCNVFIKMYNGIYTGIYNAVSKNYFFIIIEKIVHSVELLILFFGILLKVDIITLLVVYNIPALVSIMFNHYYTKKWFDVSLSFRNFDWVTFKSMLKPSVAFMLIPLGNAVSNQGLVFVVNTFLGATILVTFTTTRTLVTFMRLLSAQLVNAVYPEISVAYGRGDRQCITNIYYRSFVITLITALASIVALFFAGKPIYLVWTKHTVIFDEIFFAGMLILLFVSCLYSLSSVIPLATNTHGKFSVVFLLSQIVGVFICFVCLKIEPRIALLPFALFVPELALFVYTLKKNNQFLGTNFSEMYEGLWEQTKFLSMKLILLVKINRT